MEDVQTGEALTQYQRAFQPIAAQAVADLLDAAKRDQEHEKAA